MKNIGKPCTGKPYARFDEGGLALPALYSTRNSGTPVPGTPVPGTPLSSASMEEHFSTILAVLLLGAAMSEGSNLSVNNKQEAPLLEPPV